MGCAKVRLATNAALGHQRESSPSGEHYSLSRANSLGKVSLADIIDWHRAPFSDRTDYRSPERTSAPTHRRGGVAPTHGRACTSQSPDDRRRIVGIDRPRAQPAVGRHSQNTETAELMLKSQVPNLAEVTEILADIKRADLRATEVIQRLRRLLTKSRVERRNIDLNEIVGEVIGILAGQARAQDV